LQNNTQYIQEDKIDLSELFSILKKRKKLIWSVTGALTTLAVAYVLIKQPVYEVKSNVMVGFIGEKTKDKSNNIADPAIITKTLNLIFNVEDELETEEKFISKVSSISINKKLENFITIKTEAISNEEALKKNKEVVTYLQNLYQPKIDQYIINTKNSINNIKKNIDNINNLEIENIKEEINRLKTQKIVKINEKIEFYQKVKLPSVEKKINFHEEKLKEYSQEVVNLYKNNNTNRDTIAQTISSMQMLNYQNMILNSQNKLEDLRIEKEIIINEKIVDLQREKKNINSETIRKLAYKMNVVLVNKKRTLKEKITQLNYNISDINIQNSKVIGEYVVKDYPIKPKKTLIIIVAFITGLMLSIFLAFFLEFIQGLKKEDSK